MTVAGEVRVLVRYDVVPLPVTGSVRVRGTMVSAPFPPSPSTPSGLSVAFVDDDGEDGLCDVLVLDSRESESVGVDWLVLLLATEVVELTGNDVGSYDTVAVETVTVLVTPLRLRLGVELEALPDPLGPTELGSLPLRDDCIEMVALAEAVLGTEEVFRDETRPPLVCEDVPETGTLPDPDEMETGVDPDPDWGEPATDVVSLPPEVLEVKLGLEPELDEL